MKKFSFQLIAFLTFCLPIFCLAQPCNRPNPSDNPCNASTFCNTTQLNNFCSSVPTPSAGKVYLKPRGFCGTLESPSWFKFVAQTPSLSLVFRATGGCGIVFRSPSGTRTAQACVSRISGTALDGIYQGTAILPAFTEPGTWTLDFVHFYDTAGNEFTMYPAALQAAGFPTALRVGPRPTVREDYERMDAAQRRRTIVPPGLTGLAQISGNTGLSWPARIKYDLLYVEEHNLLLDLGIIVNTAWLIFRNRVETHPAGDDEWAEEEK